MFFEYFHIQGTVWGLRESLSVEVTMMMSLGRAYSDVGKHTGY